MKSMTKASRFNKVMSVVLTVLMVVSIMSVFSVSAVAEGEDGFKIKFVDSNGDPAYVGALVRLWGVSNEERDQKVGEDGVATYNIATDKNELKVSVGKIYKNGEIKAEDNILLSDYSIAVTLKRGETVDIVADTQAPVVTVSGNPTEWTKPGVVLTANCEDSWVRYKWNGGVASADKTFTVNENGTYTVIAVDGFGNESTPATVEVTKIDKVAPVVSVASAPDGKYHQSLTVTVTATDENGSGVAFYKMNDGKWIAATQENANVFTVTSNGTYTFSVKDVAGNEQTAQFNAEVIDTEAPIISAVTPADDKWHNNFVEYTVTATDDKKDMLLTYGVGESFETVVWETLGDNTIVVDERKAYTFWVKDSAGNYAKFKLENLPPIDKVAPKINSVVATDVNGVVVTTGSENWTNQPVTFTVSATDEGGSNIAQYSKDGTTWQDSNVFENIKSAEIFSFYVKDNAGNVSEVKNESANYDSIAPEISTVEVDPEKITSNPITFTVVATDPYDDVNAQSGIVAYCKVLKNAEIPALDSGEWQAEANFTATDCKTYHFYAVDKAGNISKVKEAVGSYDKKPATLYSVEFEQKNDSALAEFANKLSFGAFFNKSVEITVNAKDEFQGTLHNAAGVSTYKVSFYDGVKEEEEVAKLVLTSNDRKKNTFKVPQEFAEDFHGTIYVEVIDMVGNTTGEVLVVSSETTEEGTVKSNIKDLPDNMFMIESKAPDIEFTTEDIINKGVFNLVFNVADGSDAEIVSGVNLVKVTVNGKSYVDELYKGTAPVLSKDYTVAVDSFGKTVTVNGIEIADVNTVWPVAVDDKLDLTIEAIDNAGNVAEVATKDLKIDNTAPVIDAFDFGSNPNEKIDVDSDGFGFIFNSAVDVTIKASDNMAEGDTVASGVKQIAYVLIPADLEDGQTEAKLPTDFDPICINAVNGEITVSIPAGFKGQIHAYAIDNVENYPKNDDKPEYIHPYGIITETETEHDNEKDGNEPVDHVELKLSDNFVAHKENCNLYKEDVYVDVVINDRQSTIAKVDWEIVLPYIEEPAEKGTVIVENDFNENKATSYSDGIYEWKVEQRDPSLNPLGKHLTTKLSNRIIVSKDYNYDEIVVNVTMTDRAGNTTSDSVKLSIDTKAPVTSAISVMADGRDVSSETSNWTNKEVTFTVTSEDSAKEGCPFASGIVGYAVDPVDDEYAWQESPEFKFSDQKTHYFYVIDKAGNISEVATAKANYDNTKPEITSIIPTLDKQTALGVNDWTNDTVYFVLEAEDTEVNVEIADEDVAYENSGIVYYCKLSSGSTAPDENHEGWVSVTDYEFPVYDCNKYDFYVKDKAGNISVLADDDSIAAVMFDAKDPELENVVFAQENDTAIAKVINFLTFGTFFNKNVTVTVNSIDNADEVNGASGVRMIDIIFRNEDKTVEKIYTHTGALGETIDNKFTIDANDLENFKGTVSVVISDHAINNSTGENTEYISNVEIDNGDIVIINSNSNVTNEIDITTDNSNVGYTEFMIENDAPKITDVTPADETIHKDDFDLTFNTSDIVENKHYSGIGAVEVTVNGVVAMLDDLSAGVVVDEKTVAVNDGSYSLAIDTKDKTIVNPVTGEIVALANNWDSGKLSVVITVVDNAGNVSIEKRTLYIDKNSPVIDGFEFNLDKNIDVKPSENNLYKAINIDPIYGFYFKESVTVTVTASDSIYTVENDTTNSETVASGVASITYEYDGFDFSGEIVNKTETIAVVDNKISFTIPTGFKGQIYAYATDVVGNHPNDAEATFTDAENSITKADADKDERFAKYVGWSRPNGQVIETQAQHDTESSHIVFAVPETKYTQNNNIPLYNKDVTVTVTVKDSYSGIAKVEWSVVGDYDPANNQSGVVNIDNALNLDDNTWTKETTEDNIVTQIKRDIVVKNNCNDIKINVKVTDRAGNVSETTANGTYKTLVFGIDKTVPEISLTYNNNEPDDQYTTFFNKARTATITVTERNFRAKDAKFVINKDLVDEVFDGSTLAWTTVLASGANPDETTHTATITFGGKDNQKYKDADYKLTIDYMDNAENKATTVKDEFTIDETVPTVSVEYDNNDSRNGNYFKADRTATITIVEHNFDPARVVNLGVATDDGYPVTYPTISAWTTVGDTHIATVSYNADAHYTFDIDFKDMAGNNIADYDPHDFYVDKTLPALVIDGVAANSANKSEGNIGFTITASDTNMDIFAPVVKAMVLNAATGMFEEKTINLGGVIEGHNSKTYKVANLIEDGVYSITCSVVDKAGNSFNTVLLKDENGATFSEKVTDEKPLILFSVNRSGSTFFVDDKYTKNLALKDGDYYTQTVENDLLIKEFNPDSIQIGDVTITVNGKKLTEGEDYKRTASQNGGYTYLYTIFKENFKSEGEYNIVISSKDRATNEAYSDMKFGAIKFVVDKTAPVVTVTGLKTNGRYQVEKQTVTLSPTDDGGLITKLRVVLVDKDGNEIEELLTLEGQELADALAKGSIDFDIGAKNSAQYVKVICEDKAGNKIGEDGLGELFSNVTITTNGFLIFWANPVARYSAIAAVAVLVAAIIFFIVLKNKKKKETAENK